MSIDAPGEWDVPDEEVAEDVEAESGGLPFVMNRDLLDQYGKRFFISLDENKLPTVSARS